MAKTIYLLQYNNYFNRTVKGEHFFSLDNYTSAGATIVGQITNMSLWNPNDGVDTTITSNLGLTAIPDYCIVCENSNVVQRWFVMEAKRLQGQQYRLTLRRDLIADNYNEILNNNDTYVERGWCDVSNPAIYNQEPMTFNQIKNNQRSMFDKSLCPWIVMYFTPNKTIDGTESAFPDDTALNFTDEFDSTKKFSVQYKYRAADAVTDHDTIIKLPDAPYAMMALPYATKDYYDGDTKLGTITMEQAMQIAQATSRKYNSGGWLMDIQLLPFCPCAEVIRTDGNIDLSKALANARVYYDDASSQSIAHKIGGVICCRRSRFQTNIYTSTGALFKIHVYDIKLENQSTMCRLVSPNGNGVFEFNPAKMTYSNDTDIGFLARCTYMPYQPYIRVFPQFARMYGGDYNDYRGLICGGDFSLPQISDSWEAYQIQNKNYQAMFNRQIESMDKQHIAGLISDITGAVTGTVGGVAGGALSGSMVGGTKGSIAGGIVGGVASLIGGAADVGINAYLRYDQRQAVIEQHNWQLQNIQALPYSVTKVNNFNFDSNYVPYLEVYVCDDSEIDNFIKYLDLRSYSINRYGRLNDYIKPTGRTFLKGMIVRLAGVDDDSHYMAAISDEVNQGFYIEKGAN